MGLTFTLQLNHFRNKGLGIMNESPTNYNLCLLVFLSLFCFSIGYSPHIKYDY